MRSTVLLFALDGAVAEGDFVAYMKRQATDAQRKRVLTAPSLWLGEVEPVEGGLRMALPTRRALGVLGNKPRVLDLELADSIHEALQLANVSDLQVPVDYPTTMAWLNRHLGCVVYSALLPAA